jgi:outer membrane protein
MPMPPTPQRLSNSIRTSSRCWQSACVSLNLLLLPAQADDSPPCTQATIKTSHCPSAPTSWWSLSRVTELALQHDAILSAARSQRDISRYQTRMAEAPLLPHLTMTLSHTGFYERERLDSGEKLERLDSRYEISNASITLEQSLFNAADWYRYQAARSVDQQAAITLDAAHQDLLFRTGTAWFEVLRAQDALNTRQTEIESLQQDWQKTRQRHAAGLVMALEVQEALTRLDLVSATRLEDEATLRIAQLQLQQLTGRNDASVQPMSGFYPERLHHPSLQQWLELAQASSLALEIARNRWQQAQQNRNASRMDLLPSMTLKAGISREIEDAWQHSRLGTGTPMDTNSGYVGLEVAVPLYEGGSRYANNRAAAASLANSQQQLQIQQQTLITRIHTLYARLSSQQAGIKAREQALQSSQQALAATEAAWQAGLRRFVDVLNTRQDYFEAGRDLSAMRYDYLLTYLDLSREAGTLTIETISLLDQATRE